MNADIYGVVDIDGNVLNVVLWDGDTEFSLPEGTTAVKSDGVNCQIGGTYANGEFAQAPKPTPSKDQLIAQAELNKTDLINDASQMISVLQDAVDLEMATDDEKNTLIEWKRYRVILSRVDTSSAPDISWPKIPNQNFF